MSSRVRRLCRAVSATCRRLVSRLAHRAWQWVEQHGAISPDLPQGNRFFRLGAGAAIAFPPGSLCGAERIAIGDGTLVGAQVTLSAGFFSGVGPAPGEGPVVKVGRRCVVGRGSHIVAHESVVLGDDVFLGPYVYITDQNHSYCDLETPIGRQWPVNEAVSVGDGCWLGTGAVLLPGTRLGHNVAVAAGAVVRGSHPDHCLIGGVPARVLRHYDVEAGEWRPGAPESGHRGIHQQHTVPAHREAQ